MADKDQHIQSSASENHEQTYGDSVKGKRENSEKRKINSEKMRYEHADEIYE